MPLFSAASAPPSDLPPATTGGDGADGTARPPLWLPSPYLLLGGLLWAVLSAAAWQAPLCCEAGLQAAVVERLRVNLLHPAFPMTDLPAVASAHYSPYALLQGLAARATGLSGPSVVALAASVNLLLLLTGIGRLHAAADPEPLGSGPRAGTPGTDPLGGPGALERTEHVRGRGHPAPVGVDRSRDRPDRPAP